WNAFASDPEWLEKRAATEADGQIVASVNNQILMPTNFSTVK
ncbi:NIPSNAP family protein, partial [Alphaproteobacteria bacterium]|nr:NIPSNAP family protein [Alphaproteobacteria bacterium]